MEINNDLVKAILLWCKENLPSEGHKYQNFDVEIEGYTEEEVVHHISYLVDKKNYVEAEDRIEELGNKDDRYYLVGLTGKGYEYLENQ